MTEDEIRAATNEDLIARFAELGVEQYQCDDDEAWCVDVIKDDNPALIHYTRLYREMEAISKELKARGAGLSFIGVSRATNKMFRLNELSFLLTV